MENTTIFWERVNSELKKQKKTQREMCQTCNISVGSLRTRISVGNAPNLFFAYKIANYLNVTLEYLITGKTDDNTNFPDPEITLLKDKLNRIESICRE